MFIETTDEEAIQAVKRIQDKEDGALDKDGKPKIGCKLIGGKFIPLNQLPGYTPDKWRGTTEIYPIEVDSKDAKVKRLQLTDSTAQAITKAAAKPDAERTSEEKRLATAAASVKPDEPKPEDPKP